MRLPMELVEISSIDDGFSANNLCWRIAVKRRVDTIAVIVTSEPFKLSLQVTGIPENYVVRKLAACGEEMIALDVYASGRRFCLCRILFHRFMKDLHVSSFLIDTEKLTS